MTRRGQPVKRTQDEDSRLAAVYGRYARSRRKARAWAADNPGNAAIRAELSRALLRHLAPVHDRRVLDVGCGTGWWLAELIAAGVPPDRLHGVDLLEPRVHAARARVPGADVRRADARHLPYGDGSFDAVVLLTTLSSLPTTGDIQRAFRETWRVLAPGGVALVYEPRVPNPLNRATVHVRPSTLGVATRSESLTVLPPLARRLGRAYPRLARAAPLRTHRLLSAVKDGAP